MAYPTDITRTLVRISPAPGDRLLEDLQTQVNNLTATVRLITAKLDADVGVTDTNYDALTTAVAIATAPTTILVKTGL